MTNDKPKDKRRVGFRNAPSTSEASAAPSGRSYMMLDDREAERIATRSEVRSIPSASIHPDDSAAAPTSDTNITASANKLFNLSARDLARTADKSIQKAHHLGERAVNRAAVLAAPASRAARRVHLPNLASLGSFGGKRAPTDANDGSTAGDDRPPPDHPRRRHETITRVVHLNDEAKNNHFPSNYVSTTKYSLWTALPMFLYEQFTRFSNAYFLFVGIGYTIDAVSPIFTIGRYSTLWVLAVVVAISGIKEGIEDYHRYKEDRRVNRAVTHVLGSTEPEDRWANVRVGDIIKVHEKEHLPADIALVSSSSEDGLAYIETKQLDGESNLKVKVVPQAIAAAFKTDSSALLTKGRIECEAPNDRMYKFVGRIIIEKAPMLASGSKLDDESDESIETVPINEPIPLGPENIMIRGSSVMNTEWVTGVVVNTGCDTKLMQNVKPRPRKNSRLERETNRHYFLTLALQICIVVALTVRFSQVCTNLFEEGDAWYLFQSSCGAWESFLRFFTFFITFSALIPISLYVSMEIVRAFQVYFIEHDEHIVDHTTGIRTEVRTSNLNEELGVVHHVFTDKTGTLTANKMEFKKCSINGRVYESDESPRLGASSMSDLKEALQAGPESSAVRHFSVNDLEAADKAFRLLAICHSVVAEAPVDTDGAASENTMGETVDGSTGSSIAGRRRLRRRRNRGGSADGTVSARDYSLDESRDRLAARSRIPSSLNSSAIDVTSSANESNPLFQPSSMNGSSASCAFVKYQASSPDEAALVHAARKQGYTYVSRSNRDTVIDVFSRPETHQLLETIEFDSTRKRMSVITRDSDGQVRIYTKGADAVIFARLAPGQSSDVTERHLHDFAVEGLRTLCLAYADLDDEWFKGWQHRYRKASSELGDRDKAMAIVIDEIERNLTLLGATAIEDKLQEGVPETLKKLEQAGVKVWVLTGDKQETAINIGLSCGAIDEGMDVVIINEDNLEDTAAQVDRALGRWSAMRQDPSMDRKLGLVIDGQTLHYALDPDLQKKFMVVTRMARSVIACRVSPKQKTEIVELVRKHDKEMVTLAIGDGANDVGMIQAAHVGVGIVGLEGQEAKLASDYSIGQFRFLARLMLVHGRWSYKRLSKMVLFTIYKNATVTLCELYWATFSAFSGQPLLDPWMGGLYNLLLTSLPPIVLGILDQELSADYALAFPEIYLKGQRNTAYNFRVFLSWLCAALWQSAIIFYVCYWGFGDKAGANGQTLGMWPFGVVVFSVVIINVHVILLVYQSAWTKLTGILYGISFISWFIIAPLFSYRKIALDGNLSPPLYAVTHRVFSEARFWFVAIICPVLCASPSLLWKYSKRRRRPNMKMLVQELMRSGKTREEIVGEPPKALNRVPSYDPMSHGTPSGPVTFVVKGEKEYQFSGFNFDPDETIIFRHPYRTPHGTRRKRMRVLRRAGSDTELDVEGVTTGRVHMIPSAGLMTAGWVEAGGQGYPRGPLGLESVDMDRLQKHDGEHSVVPLGFPSTTEEVANAIGNNGRKATHRRAISDGAVLVEDRYKRLDERQHDGGGQEDDTSSDDGIERER